MNRFVSLIFAFLLAGCASTSTPNTFVYETSLRGEQGWQGASARSKAAAALLTPGVVVDPTTILQARFPEAQIKVKRWGVSYFPSNWNRYQTILNADIRRGDEIVKCRLRAPETPVGAMTLNEVRANDGAALQSALQDLVAACAAQVG